VQEYISKVQSAFLSHRNGTTTKCSLKSEFYFTLVLQVLHPIEYKI